MKIDRPCVLLMDTDAETLEQLQTVLQRQGYYVLVAADGYAALQLAERARPRLIVSDLVLAGLDAYEVWVKINRSKSEPRVPVLVVSALNLLPAGTPWRSNSGSKWQLLAYDAFLPKPVDLRRFLRLVKKLTTPEQADAVPGGPAVLLAVEDRSLQAELARILAAEDFEVDTPENLPRAEQLLLKNLPPAVIVFSYTGQDDELRRVVVETRKRAPGTAIVLLAEPHQTVNPDIAVECHGILARSTDPAYVVSTINQVIEYHNLQRRVELLSRQVLEATQELAETRHIMQAQNEELQLVNAQIRELADLKETLTGMVAHDLRTPLSAVLGALSFLFTDPDVKLSSVAETLMTGAMAAGQQMVRLTETLLDGQRLEQGRLQPDIEPFHLPTVIDVSLQQATPLLTMHRLTVDTVFPDEELPLALADPHLSQRILENLLDNAIKFSPRDDRIEIGVKHEGDFLKVWVADHGPGIPKEEQASVFELFTQLKKEEGAGKSRTGFGLGLHFCRLATEAMGGKIWLESDGQTGTTFVFTLPVFREEGD